MTKAIHIWSRASAPTLGILGITYPGFAAVVEYFTVQSKPFLNTLLSDKACAKHIALEAVSEAAKETGDGDYGAEALARIDREIESAQTAMPELNKRRARREIDAEAYGERSRATMAELDGFFIRRDELARQAGDGSLDDARRKMLMEFLSAQGPQTEFDRDVFGKLVETVIVNNRDDIILEFKDGTEVKAVIADGK